MKLCKYAKKSLGLPFKPRKQKPLAIYYRNTPFPHYELHFKDGVDFVKPNGHITGRVKVERA